MTSFIPFGRIYKCRLVIEWQQQFIQQIWKVIKWQTVVDTDKI
jgi:hypothetical protein